MKTSSCTGERQVSQGRNPGRRRSCRRRGRPRARNPRPSAGQARVELEDVVRHPGRDVVTVPRSRRPPPRRAGRRAGRRSTRPRRSAPRRSAAPPARCPAATRRSSRITGRPRACFDATTFAGSPPAIRARADREELGRLARVLDDERAVETVRLADTSDDDRLRLIVHPHRRKVYLDSGCERQRPRRSPSRRARGRAVARHGSRSRAAHGACDAAVPHRTAARRASRARRIRARGRLLRRTARVGRLPLRRA